MRNQRRSVGACPTGGLRTETQRGCVFALGTKRGDGGLEPRPLSTAERGCYSRKGPGESQRLLRPVLQQYRHLQLRNGTSGMFGKALSYRFWFQSEAHRGGNSQGQNCMSFHRFQISDTVLSTVVFLFFPTLS